MKKNLLALLFGIIIALGLLEIGLKITNPFKFRVKGNKINLPYNGKWNFENDKIKGLDKVIHTSRNSLGFRGPMPKKPIEDLLSIITIGGSTTECYYVSDNKTWPDILAKLLSNDSGNVWLNNAGFDGHTTYGHIILLRDHISKIKPKFAIFLIGGNDLGKFYSSQDSKMLREKKKGPYLKKTILKLSEHIDTFSIILNLYRYYNARKSQFFHRELDLAKLDYIDISEEKTQHYIEMNNEIIINYKERLIEIVQICKDNNIIPIFLTHPALYGRGVDTISGVDLERVKMSIIVDYKGSHIINGRTMWKILEKYNDETRSVARDNNILCIDMAKLMPKSTEYFYDFHHFTNKGCEKFGQIVYHQIKNFLGL